MTNRQIAAILFNISTLHEMDYGNVYRIRAYRRAARRVMALPEPATDIVARGEELPLPGVGERIKRRLAELIATGQLADYEEMLEELPSYMGTLMRIEGIGPKTALRLHRELGLADAEDVMLAARCEQIRTLYGFAQRRESLLADAAQDQLTSQQTSRVDALHQQLIRAQSVAPRQLPLLAMAQSEMVQVA